MMTWFQVHLVQVRNGRRLNYVGPWLILGVMMLAAGCGGDPSAPQAVPTIVHFVPNSHAFWSNSQNWTTSYGPAYADILLQPSNFVPCRGGPFALCYYSGPSSGSEDLSCKLTTDGEYANCQCFDVPYGVYFVDINAILNYSVYQSTIAQCGADGSACATPNSAPVCQAVNQGTLIPHAAVFSTFSFDCVPTNGIGQTSCSSAPYAGCMTAPCSAPDASGIVQCSCPVFDGPFQIGQNNQACTLGDGLVWSAAYAPPTAALTSPTSAVSSNAVSGTTPAPAACVPDAPGGLGCPLYVPGTTSLPPNSGINCQTVCDEYSSCTHAGGIQTGLTCDSTLCTDQCNDLDVVGEACASLAKCDVSEIIKAEQAAQCSCCASQLCGCQANTQTNATIASLVQQQRDLGIKPQCDINGTLCGSP
jgi:hypothetical protein